MNRLGLAANTQRLPIFGLGCAGGVVGLGHAAALARGLSHGDVLFLSVELCALTVRYGDVLAVRQPRPEPRNDVKTAGLDESLGHTDDGRVITTMQVD